MDLKEWKEILVDPEFDQGRNLKPAAIGDHRLFFIDGIGFFGGVVLALGDEEVTLRDDETGAEFSLDYESLGITTEESDKLYEQKRDKDN